MLIVSMCLVGELRSKFYEKPSIYFILATPDQTLIEVVFPRFLLPGLRPGINKRYCLSGSFVREVVGNIFIYLDLYTIETKILINYEAPKIFRRT